MNRQGFTLIEIMIAVAIAAFMTTILFTALFQINKSVDISEAIITVHEKAARLQQLFERDLSGATTLLDNEPPKKSDKDLTSTTTGDKQGQEKKDEKQAEKQPEKQEKKEKHIVKKIFNSTNKGGQLGELTFISNNPLLGFWAPKTSSGQAGKAKPFVVRITYQLKEDPTKPGSFILMRQESIPLDYEKRSGRSYEVLEGIKNITIEYTSKTVKTVEPKEEKAETKKPDEKTGDKDLTKKAEPKKEKTKTEVTYESGLGSWSSDEKQEAEKDAKKEEPKEKRLPVPVFVKINVVLWDNAQQREYPYQFFLEIITDTQFVQKKKPFSFMSFFQKPQEKPDEKKAAQPNQQQSDQQKPSQMPPQKTVFNTFGPPPSNLQRQLEELFKTAHSFDNRRAL